MNKPILKLLPAICLLFFAQDTFSQVTLLSNNTNLTSGIAFNGKGFLFQNSGNSVDSLWVTDGTPAGTVKLVNTVSYIDTGGGALYNGRAFFSGANAATGTELWATDGTAAGTTLIKDINPGTGSSVPTDFIVYNNTLFFTADNGTLGLELWKSDGTTAGTVLVKDVYTGAGSGFSYTTAPSYTISNGILYFLATTAAEGRELWRTDGTTAGTRLVQDITPGAASTTFDQFSPLGPNLIFGVKAGTAPFFSFQLWKSDGTSSGTTLLTDFGAQSGLSFSSFYTFNNKVYFSAGDMTTIGSELWVTDGTTAGTTLVKDINPGIAGSNPFLFFAITINNKFYFQATTANEGSELWVSDGTTAGTQLLKDIYPGPNGSNPIILKSFDYNGFSNTLYNNKIFFEANDGTHGTELWITDGTSAGTTLVKDINPGSASGLGSGSFNYIYTTSGLFFSANDGVTGIEPWISDGTTSGTARIADLNPGLPGSDPTYLFVLNNQLYLNANNGDDSTATDLFKINTAVSLLPINLFNFSASVESANAVKLNWTTSNEVNSSHFDIERSVDGSKFSSINKLDAAGNSSLNINYSYLDKEAGSLNSPVLYYRLRMVDRDGQFKWSPTLLVRLVQNQLQLSFSPNPVRQELSVLARPGGAKDVALRIVDANGKILYLQTVKDGLNILQQKIKVADFQNGVYFIQLITDQTTTTKKFVKQ